MPLIGNWNKIIKKMTSLSKTISKTAVATNLVIAQQIQSDIKTGIQESSPGGQDLAANHPFTVALKGSSKPLIDKGDLIGNVTISPKLWVTFVGILRGTQKKGSSGKKVDLVNIAYMQENGYQIKVTDKMRGFLAFHGLYLKETTTHLIVPPRPFIKPVFDQWKHRAPILYVGSFSKKLSKAL